MPSLLCTRYAIWGAQLGYSIVLSSWNGTAQAMVASSNMVLSSGIVLSSGYSLAMVASVSARRGPLQVQPLR
eukprot:1862650-Rhodomonas_salina.1